MFAKVVFHRNSFHRNGLCRANVARALIETPPQPARVLLKSGNFPVWMIFFTAGQARRACDQTDRHSSFGNVKSSRAPATFTALVETNYKFPITPRRPE